MRVTHGVVFKSLLISILFAVLSLYTAQDTFACVSAPYFPATTHVTMSGTTEALLVWKGKYEQLIVNPQFAGDAKDFGLLFAVPAKPEITEASKTLFSELRDYTDPLVRPRDRSKGLQDLFGSSSSSVPESTAVNIVQEQDIAEFHVVTLTATDSKDLIQWLSSNNYVFNKKDRDNFDYYISQGGFYFVAVKINPKKVAQGVETYNLTPLNMTFEAFQPSFPLRLAAEEHDSSQMILYTISSKPLMIPGSGIMYTQQVARDVPSFLKDFHSEGKWLTRGEVTLNPQLIKIDPPLVQWNNPTPIHIFEDEKSLVIDAKDIPSDAGISSARGRDRVDINADISTYSPHQNQLETSHSPFEFLRRLFRLFFFR